MMNRNDHWRIIRPRSSHYKPASCERVSCRNFYKGWQTVLGGNQIDEIEMIRHSNMRYTEAWIDGTSVVFTFEAGQECFTGQANGHVTNLERDPIYKKNQQVMEPNQWTDGLFETFYQLGR